MLRGKATMQLHRRRLQAMPRTWPMSAMARKLTVDAGPVNGAVTKLATSDQP